MLAGSLPIPPPVGPTGTKAMPSWGRPTPRAWMGEPSDFPILSRNIIFGAFVGFCGFFFEFLLLDFSGFFPKRFVQCCFFLLRQHLFDNHPPTQVIFVHFFLLDKNSPTGCGQSRYNARTRKVFVGSKSYCVQSEERSGGPLP